MGKKNTSKSTGQSSSGQYPKMKSTPTDKHSIPSAANVSHDTLNNKDKR